MRIMFMLPKGIGKYPSLFTVFYSNITIKHAGVLDSHLDLRFTRFKFQVINSFKETRVLNLFIQKLPVVPDGFYSK